MTGAKGRIGRLLCESLGETCLPITRDGCERVHASDLESEPPRLRDGTPSPEWIVHLATTHGPSDLDILKNLLSFCFSTGVRKVIFLSTWSVLFPEVGIDATYTTVKRDCENVLISSRLDRCVIVRPSVVVGSGEQQWDDVLRRLSPFGQFLAGSYRCFVSIDVVIDTILAVVSGNEKRDVITLLGERRSLRSAVPPSRLAIPVAASALLIVTSVVCIVVAKARPSPSRIAAAAVVATIVWLVCRYAIARHSFARSFFRSDLFPRTVADVLSVSEESNFSIRGENNKNMLFSPMSARPDKPIVSLRCLKGMEFTGEGTVRVGAGVTFLDLIPFLRNRGVALQNCPNYHNISIGACIATPVHGSDLNKPFVADLVRSFSYVHAGALKEVDRTSPERFYGTLFRLPRGAMVVSACLEVNPSVAKYFSESRTLYPCQLLSFFRNSPSDAACEVRQSSPRSEMVSTVFHSIQGCDACDDVKATSIGSVWNKLGYFLPIVSYASRAIVNVEWFVSPSQLTELVEEIQRSPFYKLLYRYNRTADLASALNPYYGTVSIDFLCPPSGIARARELYYRFNPLEHTGKHMIGRRES